MLRQLLGRRGFGGTRRARPSVLGSALALAAGLVTLVVATPSRAFSHTSFPTLSRGDRGEDVRALEYLLRDRGYGLGADGVFDRETRAAVAAFQSSLELEADGIVGRRTWRVLIMDVGPESAGDAVRALQSQLNAKASAGLDEDGVFGPATLDAVTAFQEHVGLTADGVVRRTTWKNFLWHYDQVEGSGRLCVLSREGRWGTGATAARLERAARRFRAAGNGALALGDVSVEHGDPFPPHVSHRLGMDADVRPVRRDGDQCSDDTRWDRRSYDRRGTRGLVLAIREAARGRVKVIWFNDPVLVEEGLTEPLPGHDDHLHVRYCAPGHPDVNYAC